MPNEMVAGSAVTVARVAAPASSMPAPIHSASTGLAESSVVTVWAEELTINDRTCVPRSPGCACIASAAAPAVSAAEKLVPSTAMNPLAL